jgi:ATP-dependent protease ClpP protease subunit
MTEGPSEAYLVFAVDVTPESVAEAVGYLSDLAEAGVTRVVLAIQTNGGGIDAGMHLYEQLRNAPFELVTHAVGYVKSVGIPIYLAGDVRLAGPYCRFLMHRPSLTVQSNTALDTPALRELTARLEAYEKRTRAVYEDRTVLPTQSIDALKGASAEIGAREAIAMGIAHRVESLVIPPGYGLHIVGDPAAADD